MKSYIQVLVVVLLVAFPLTVHSDPVVTTSHGKIVGTTMEFKAPELQMKTSIHAYLGIPYAEPPVGPLRFKPPVPKSWNGELLATKPGNRCQQPKENVFYIHVGGQFDEDCLYLDVFVPTPKPINAAVMLWIHGGGYFAGAGTIEEVHPSPLVAIGDVIVVTINYRLGAFGFLSTDDNEAPGNVGMLDQVEAMKWVQRNIADFGGDPDRVTIFGMSAGGSCVSLQTLSPLSDGLFSGAIVQSGSLAAPWAGPWTFSRTPGSGKKKALHFGSVVGCQQTTSAELIGCLQNVPADDIVRATPQFGDIVEGFADDMLFFTPTIDGRFLTENPVDLLAKGLVHDDISIIVGETADDGMLSVVVNFINSKHKPHINAEAFDNFLDGVLLSHPAIKSAIKSFYLDNRIFNEVNANYVDDLGKILTDYMFGCAGNKVSEGFARAGRKVYRYHLNHMPSMSFYNTTWEGVCHLEDILYIFGAHFYEGSDFIWTDEEVDVTVQIMRYWSNFAKTGNPNLVSLNDEHKPEEQLSLWPPFTIEEAAFKDLSFSMRTGHALKAKECGFWNDFMPKLNSLISEHRLCRSLHHWTSDTTTCAADDTSCNVMDTTP